MTQNETRKELAIEALGVGLSVIEASERANVSRATVYRWLEDETFSKAVLSKKREVLERLSSRLSGLALRGLQVLDELMASEDENIRLRASNGVLSRFTEVLEVLQLERRVETLENEARSNRSKNR
jgi:hypothetical protein